jgi:hypothetical protein
MANGWAISLMDVPLTEFNKSIIKYPSIKRFPGGASNDLLPNLPASRQPLARDGPGQGADDYPSALSRQRQHSSLPGERRTSIIGGLRSAFYR